MPSSSSGAIMAKTGTSPAAHDSRYLALRDNASIRHKAVFAGIERRHATRELARKAGSIGIANRQDKVHAFVGRQGYGLIDQIVSPIASRAAAKKHAFEQSSIKRAERRRDELIARVLVAAQHDQRLGATVVSDQSSAPASHVSIRNKARRHTKPIIDHLFHNPSVRIGGINR